MKAGVALLACPEPVSALRATARHSTTRRMRDGAIPADRKARPQQSMQPDSPPRTSWLLPGLIALLLVFIVAKTLWGRLVNNPSEQAVKLSYLLGRDPPDALPAFNQVKPVMGEDLEKLIEQQKNQPADATPPGSTPVLHGGKAGMGDG